MLVRAFPPKPLYLAYIKVRIFAGTLRETSAVTTARGDWSGSSSSPGLHLITGGIVIVATSVNHTEHTEVSQRDRKVWLQGQTTRKNY